MNFFIIDNYNLTNSRLEPPETPYMHTPFTIESDLNGLHMMNFIVNLGNKWNSDCKFNLKRY